MAYINIHDRGQLRVCFELFTFAIASPVKGVRQFYVAKAIREIGNTTSLSTRLDTRICHLAYAIIRRKRPLCKQAAREAVINATGLSR